MPHAALIAALEEGDIVKLDDGKMQMTVMERIDVARVRARVDFGGVLTNHKGVNIPTRRIPVSGADREGQSRSRFRAGAWR